MSQPFFQPFAFDLVKDQSLGALIEGTFKSMDGLAIDIKELTSELSRGFSKALPVGIRATVTIHKSRPNGVNKPSMIFRAHITKWRHRGQPITVATPAVGWDTTLGQFWEQIEAEATSQCYEEPCG